MKNSRVTALDVDSAVAIESLVQDEATAVNAALINSNEYERMWSNQDGSSLSVADKRAAFDACDLRGHLMDLQRRAEVYIENTKAQMQNAVSKQFLNVKSVGRTKAKQLYLKQASAAAVVLCWRMFYLDEDDEVMAFHNGKRDLWPSLPCNVKLFDEMMSNAVASSLLPHSTLKFIPGCASTICEPEPPAKKPAKKRKEKPSTTKKKDAKKTKTFQNDKKPKFSPSHFASLESTEEKDEYILTIETRGQKNKELEAYLYGKKQGKFDPLFFF